MPRRWFCLWVGGGGGGIEEETGLDYVHYRLANCRYLARRMYLRDTEREREREHLCESSCKANTDA